MQGLSRFRPHCALRTPLSEQRLDWPGSRNRQPTVKIPSTVPKVGTRRWRESRSCAAPVVPFPLIARFRRLGTRPHPRQRTTPSQPNRPDDSPSSQSRNDDLLSLGWGPATAAPCYKSPSSWLYQILPPASTIFAPSALGLTSDFAIHIIPVVNYALYLTHLYTFWDEFSTFSPPVSGNSTFYQQPHPIFFYFL